MFVDLNANFSVAYCLFDSLLNLFRNVLPHIICGSFSSRICIVAIILNVLMVLTFSIESGFAFHGVSNH